MPRYFTHYWKNDTFNGYKATEQDTPLTFIASNQFRDRGISSGDEVFIVSVFDGVIWLVLAFSALIW